MVPGLRYAGPEIGGGSLVSYSPGWCFWPDQAAEMGVAQGRQAGPTATRSSGGPALTDQNRARRTRPTVTELSNYAKAFISNEEGAALLEYAMLAMLIALLCVVALKSIGSKVGNMYGQANNLLP